LEESKNGLLKSREAITKLGDEKSSLLDRMNLLERALHESKERNPDLESRFAKLENYLEDSNKLTRSLSLGTEKLDNMLSVRRYAGDKRGLGYTGKVSTSSSF
ncbi:unnamed protein product, partial [Ilex paraguariensis]